MGETCDETRGADSKEGFEEWEECGGTREMGGLVFGEGSLLPRTRKRRRLLGEQGEWFSPLAPSMPRSP